MKLTVTVALDTDRDRDLIAWLDARPNRSAAIRAAIRESLPGCRPGADRNLTLERIERKLDALLAGTSGGEACSSTEPPDIAAALDCLGV